MDDKKVLRKLLVALLIGLTGTVGTLLLLARGASAGPMLQQADLSVHKSADPDPALAGELLVYSITVSNSGSASATDIILVDALPSGLTGVTAAASQGSCSTSADTVTCNLESLLHGTLGITTAEVTITATVAPSTRGTLTNTVEVTAEEPGGTPITGTDVIATAVNAEADLAVSKADRLDPVIAGDTLTYTLTITNNGPSDASGVTVIDTLPVSVTFESATSSLGDLCEEVDGMITCTLGSLDDGDNATVTVIVTPTDDGKITNTASVTANELDPETTNNTATEDTVVNPGADLSVTKTASPDPVAAGTNLTYTLTVTNDGPSDANNVMLTDMLPTGVRFLWSTPGPPTCTESSGTVTCDLDTMPSGDSDTVTIAIEVPPSMTAATITNVAEVAGSEADPQTDNNSVDVETAVEVETDLGVNKTDDPEPVTAGTNLTYTLTVTNDGPSDATGVTVDDPLPLGVTFVLSTASQGSYDSGTGVWTVGDLAHDGTATLNINVIVNPSTSGSLSNSATVSGNGSDPNAANDTFTQHTDVEVETDLRVAKSAPATVDAGEEMTYTLTFTNSGPSDATSVVVTDTLDPNVDYVSASPPRSGLSDDGDPYWSFARLEPDESRQITLCVRVHSPLPNNTVLTNTATIDGAGIDPDTGSNIAQAQTTVHSAPILHMVKRDDPDPAHANGNLFYTIAISNTGNENATGATLVETYDPNVAFQWASPDPDTGDNRWDIGTVEVGTPVAVNVVVQVTDTLPVGTVLTNTVTLDTDQTEPIIATETTSVDTVSELTISKSTLTDHPEAGGDLEYFIYYQASGTAPAFDVVITETYDSRVTFVSATRPRIAGTDNVWDIGDLDVNDAGWFRVRVHVDTPLADGTILTNVVTIDSRDTDPLSFTETTRIYSDRDLTLSVTDDPDPVAAGAPLAYTLRYTNTGNADATGVFITATLDSHVSFADATPWPDDGSDRVWVWNTGTIAGEGGYGEIVIHTNVTLPLTDDTWLDFVAQLEDAEGDFLEETVDTLVNSAPDLSLQNSNDVSSVEAGERFTYTLTYANDGNENAYGVTITDTLTLPDYVASVGCGETEGGECESVSANAVVFHIPCLTAQTSGQAQVVVRLEDPLPARAYFLTNTARMAHPSLALPIDAYDVDPIETRPDLHVTAVHEPSLFSPGKRMTYTVTYGNQGEHMYAQDVVIATTLPTGTVYVSDSPPSYNWESPDGRTYTYAAGDLSPGSTGHTLTFAVEASDEPCQSNGICEFNTPFIMYEDGGDGGDADLGDNVYTVTIGMPDVVVVDFTAEPLPLKADVPMTFTVVLKNQGSGWAWNPDNGGGFYIDIFIAPIPSCPWKRYSENDIFTGTDALAPGAERTITLTYEGFSEQEIRNGIRAFYVKADNYADPVKDETGRIVGWTRRYGIVPECDEMNNLGGPIFPGIYRIYLPLALK